MAQQRAKADPSLMGRGGRPPQSRPPYGHMQGMPPSRRPMGPVGGPRGRPPYQAPPRHHMVAQQIPKPKPFNIFTILEKDEVFGKVRKVMSGDFLLIEVLREKAAEKREFCKITLSDVFAPRISKNGDSDDERLFAWES